MHCAGGEDAVSAQAVRKRGLGHIEGERRRPLVSAAVAQYRGEHIPFDVDEPSSKDWHLGFVWTGAAELTAQDVACGQLGSMKVDRAQKRHLELADVARPRCLREQLQLVGIDRDPRLLWTDFREKVSDEERDVARAGAQWWKLDEKSGQAVV